METFMTASQSMQMINKSLRVMHFVIRLGFVFGFDFDFVIVAAAVIVAEDGLFIDVDVVGVDNNGNGGSRVWLDLKCSNDCDAMFVVARA